MENVKKVISVIGLIVGVGMEIAVAKDIYDYFHDEDEDEDEVK